MRFNQELQVRQEHRHQFLLEEYRKLSAELSWLLNFSFTLTKYAALLPAVVFTWLATESIGIENGGFCYELPHDLIKSAWYIPFATSLAISLMLVAAQLRAGEYGKYLDRVELHFGLGDQLGWQGYFSRQPAMPTYLASTLILGLLGGTFFVGWKATEILDSQVTAICTGTAEMDSTR